MKRYGHPRWKELQMPEKAERFIERQGYQVGEYRLTLDADNVLDMLVGDHLYNKDSTFIRELFAECIGCGKSTGRG